MDQYIRLFFIINKLIEAPLTVRTLQENLFDEFKTEKGINVKEIYSDIKQLKRLGFSITKTKRTKNSGGTFQIEKTPFRLNLKDENKVLINDIFKSYSKKHSQPSELFESMSNLLDFDLENILKKEDISSFENREIYLKIKPIFEKAILEKKKVCFKYRPIGKEIKIYYGFPFKIERDEKNVERVILYNEYFLNYSEYNFDRIFSIPEILDKEVLSEVFPPYFARFKLYPPVSMSYHRLPGEEIESYDDEENTKIIKVRFFTTFRLIQKLLKYGEFAKILDPPEAINQIKLRIEKLSKIYK